MKIKIIGLAILSSALLLGLWSYSQATGNEITVCAKKSGLVYVIGDGFKRTDCKENDALLTWNVVGIKGDKGDKGDQGEQGPAGVSGNSLHLYDANNQDLGIVMNGPGYGISSFQTFLPTLGAFVSFHQSANNLIIIGTSPGVFYTGTNCTGDPFSAGLPLYVINDEHGHYFVSTNDLPITRTALSVTTTNGCTAQSTPYQNTFLLQQVALPFTDSIAWPLHIQ